MVRNLIAEKHIYKNKLNNQTKGFDALGDVLKPAGPASSASSGAGSVQTGNVLGSAIGGVQNASAAPQPSSTANPGKVLTGDLDSSLASLAENLTINKSASAQVK